jgi:hypothetical protein
MDAGESGSGLADRPARRPMRWVVAGAVAAAVGVGVVVAVVALHDEGSAPAPVAEQQRTSSMPPYTPTTSTAATVSQQTRKAIVQVLDDGMRRYVNATNEGILIIGHTQYNGLMGVAAAGKDPESPAAKWRDFKVRNTLELSYVEAHRRASAMVPAGVTLPGVDQWLRAVDAATDHMREWKAAGDRYQASMAVYETFDAAGVVVARDLQRALTAMESIVDW